MRAAPTGKNFQTHNLPEDFASGEAVQDMYLKLLMFLSRQFQGAQLRWPTANGEGYAIVSAFKAGKYKFYGLAIFGNHRNLAYIFSLEVMVAKLSKTTAQELLHWHIYLGKFRYDTMHLLG